MKMSVFDNHLKFQAKRLARRRMNAHARQFLPAPCGAAIMRALGHPQPSYLGTRFPTRLRNAPTHEELHHGDSSGIEPVALSLAAPSRRRFLQGAAGLAFPFIVPASALEEWGNRGQ